MRRLVDLARPGVQIAIADGNVPVGRYTTLLLGRMSRTGLYGDDFQKRFMANVVSQETNVRAVLAKVSLDEVDAGIVYATDARTAAERITVIDVPERANVIAEYPIAALKAAPQPDLARRWIDLVKSAAGAAALLERGRNCSSRTPRGCSFAWFATRGR